MSICLVKEEKLYSLELRDPKSINTVFCNILYLSFADNLAIASSSLLSVFILMFNLAQT